MNVAELIQRLEGAPKEWAVVDPDGTEIAWVELGLNEIILNID